MTVWPFLNTVCASEYDSCHLGLLYILPILFLFCTSTSLSSGEPHWLLQLSSLHTLVTWVNASFKPQSPCLYDGGWFQSKPAWASSFYRPTVGEGSWGWSSSSVKTNSSQFPYSRTELKCKRCCCTEGSKAQEAEMQPEQKMLTSTKSAHLFLKH